MTDWIVQNGQLKLIWKSEEDLIQFIDEVIRPNAEMLGLEVTVTRKQQKKAKIAQV